MRDVCSLICLALIGLFRSRASLQAEILTLRHQLNVLRRKSPQRLTFISIDRLVFAGLYRLAPTPIAVQLGSNCHIALRARKTASGYGATGPRLNLTEVSDQRRPLPGSGAVAVRRLRENNASNGAYQFG